MFPTWTRFQLSKMDVAFSVSVSCIFRLGKLLRFGNQTSLRHVKTKPPLYPLHVIVRYFRMVLPAATSWRPAQAGVIVVECWDGVERAETLAQLEEEWEAAQDCSVADHFAELLLAASVAVTLTAHMVRQRIRHFLSTKITNTFAPFEGVGTLGLATSASGGLWGGGGV